MKKTLLGLGLALLVLMCVLVVNTLRYESRQGPQYDRVELAVDTEGAIERMSSAIRFRTISNEGGANPDTAAFRGLHRHFETAYPLVHERLTLEKVGPDGLSLLYGWAGSDATLPPVILMGHQDVVPVEAGSEENWTHPPFSGAVADGYIWGRGAMDDKSSVVSALEAVESLLAEGHQPSRTIYLAFGHDEEIGGTNGARVIAALLADRGVTEYGFVLDEGGIMGKGMFPGVEATLAVIGIAEKGSVTLTLEVAGPGGHSSTPPNESNIGIISRAITRLEENQFPSSLDGGGGVLDYIGPEMPFVQKMAMANRWLLGGVITRQVSGSREAAALLRTTTAATVFNAGTKSNLLPTRASASVNFRIVPGQTPETVAERVRQVIDDERVSVTIVAGASPSPSSDPTSEAYLLIERTIREVIPEDPLLVSPYLVIAATDARHFAPRSDRVFRFLPMVFEEGDLQRIHGRTNVCRSKDSRTRSGSSNA